MANYFSKVFISHATEDAEIAKNYWERLNARGVKCWCYEFDLQFAAKIESVVCQQISEADFLIVILSHFSVRSEWVAWELGEAVRLQRERGSDCPIIIPVTKFKGPAKSLQRIQPRIMQTNDPAGPPLDFSSHRMHSSHAEEEFELLVHRLTPTFTVIDRPEEAGQRELFDKTYGLMTRLFIDPLSRPDRSYIKEHLGEQACAKSVNGWKLTLLATHFDETVIGFLYMSLNMNSRLCWVTFTGIAPEWRGEERFEKLIENGRELLLGECPELHAVFFEVELMDFTAIRHWHEEGAAANVPYIEEQARRLKRIRFYERACRARLLCDNTGLPLPIIQPCMDLPLEENREKFHFLMIVTEKNEAPETDICQNAIATYFDGFMAGWGPNGANLERYEEYIDNIRARQALLTKGDLCLRRITVNQSLEKLKQAHERVRI